MVDSQFTFTETDLAAAVRGLREALGRSQEVMASIIGCSLPSYQKWETGAAAPGGEWLIRLLQLCPNEETRNAFRIRAERRSAPSKRPSFPPLVRPLSHEERARYQSAAHHAIDEICKCGAAGNVAADSRLRDFAENLQDAARYYQSVLNRNAVTIERE